MLLQQEQMRITEQQREIFALRETLQAEMKRREKEVVEEVRKLSQDEVERSLELARVKAVLATREDALTIALNALRHYAGGHWPHNSLARGALEQVERLLAREAPEKIGQEESRG